MLLEGCVIIVRRLAAAGLTVIFDDVALAKLPLLKTIVILVATLCDKFVKFTCPLTAVAVTVPCNAPEPPLRVAVTTVLLSLLIKLPNESSIRTTGCCTNTTPAVALLDGCVAIVNRLAGALPTTKLLLTPLLKPLLLAVSCLLPVTSILKFVNEATPLAALVPISIEVVPCNGPVPLLNVIVTVRFDDKPTIELFPYWSWDLTTG
jgi:hypothetical protein